MMAALFALMQISVWTQTPPKDMVLIPAGEFEMGDHFKEGLASELPVHTVYVSAFYICKYEMTYGQAVDLYRWSTNHGYQYLKFGKGRGTNYPIHSINWYNSVKLCNALSEREGLVPAYYTNSTHTGVYRWGDINLENEWVKWDGGYRLPTEAEWEKAARGGLVGKRFPWGDIATYDDANYHGHGTYFTPEPGKASTSPVGSFPPNGYGVYDMMGNIREWCWDWHNDTYYSESPRSDPKGPSSGTIRATRGGDWLNPPIFGRISLRGPYVGPGSGSDTMGFRMVIQTLPVIPYWKEVIEKMPERPKYSPGPEKPPGKDSLIVVTHGWQPLWKQPQMDWVIQFTNAVTKYLKENNLNNWHVHAHDWLEKANTKTPMSAIGNAESEGYKLGNLLLDQKWGNIHFVGHSAGSALIQAATEALKESQAVIHETFLDAYVGVAFSGKSKYGRFADWAEHYFSYDPDTILTDRILENAYNVDVTSLDLGSKTRVKVSVSTPDGNVTENCFQTVSSTHGWPHEFYTKSITDLVLRSTGFGFQLSMEGGGWNSAVAKYKVGNTAPHILGNGELSCIPKSKPFENFESPPVDFSSLRATESLKAAIKKDKNGFVFTTQSPVWIVVDVTVTNAVNMIFFDSSFLSEKGAEGILTVYLGTNIIGAIDEQITPKGYQTYTFMLPETVSGDQALGFRLDTLSPVASTAAVTNAVFKFIGIKDPFSLSFVGFNSERQPLLKLTGPVGFNYTIESSINLIDWTPMAVIENTSGIVTFAGVLSDDARFYRASVQ